ncbi:hypothetical protein [uncultured Helicobacter sp.]|uniref:hypothetical protein n=1 Tax=uncultured Helicobacter sp. TaxID=175537 RepID=UPI00374F5CBE
MKVLVPDFLPYRRPPILKQMQPQKSLLVVLTLDSKLYKRWQPNKTKHKVQKMTEITQVILQNSEFIISLIAVFIAAVSACVAIGSIRLSRVSFRKTTTLQVEISILNAYKEYMSIMHNNTSDKYRQNAKIQFLVTLDLYCKYVVKGHLDKELSDDNRDFIKKCILTFKEEIKKDLKGYNNITDYAKKYNISLD